MPRLRTVSLMTKEERSDYNREAVKKYNEKAVSGYYTDEQLLKIRKEIWEDVFRDVAVDLGISEFNPSSMTKSELLRLLATMMEKV